MSPRRIDPDAKRAPSAPARLALRTLRNSPPFCKDCADPPSPAFQGGRTGTGRFEIREILFHPHFPAFRTCGVSSSAKTRPFVGKDQPWSLFDKIDHNCGLSVESAKYVVFPLSAGFSFQTVCDGSDAPGKGSPAAKGHGRTEGRFSGLEGLFPGRPREAGSGRAGAVLVIPLSPGTVPFSTAPRFPSVSCFSTVSAGCGRFWRRRVFFRTSIQGTGWPKGNPRGARPSGGWIPVASWPRRNGGLPGVSLFRSGPPPSCGSERGTGGRCPLRRTDSSALFPGPR